MPLTFGTKFDLNVLEIKLFKLFIIRNNVFLIIHFTNIYKPMFHFYTSWKHQKTGGETLVENGLKFKKN